MEVRFRDDDLDRLETDPDFHAGFERQIVRKYRQVMQLIRSAVDDRDIREMKSLRYEKLKGDRSHQRSLRLNDQWRLVLEPEGKGDERVIVIVRIEDYH